MIDNYNPSSSQSTSRARFPVIGTLATMPSRIESLSKMIDGILPQVDRLYIFLDGFEHVPAILQDRDACSIINLAPDDKLHHSNCFLAPLMFASEAIVVCFDDDILYPPNYVKALHEALIEYHYRAVVGIEGNIFWPPHQSYVRHRINLHFSKRLPRDTTVHQLGVGTVAYLSTMLPIDPKVWRHPTYRDLCVAAEAVKASLPMISLRRDAGWLQPISLNQPDSRWSAILRDDRLPTLMMRRLIASYVESGSHENWYDSEVAPALELV